MLAVEVASLLEEASGEDEFADPMDSVLLSTLPYNIRGFFILCVRNSDSHCQSGLSVCSVTTALVIHHKPIAVRADPRDHGAPSRCVSKIWPRDVRRLADIFHTVQAITHDGCPRMLP